MRVLHYYYRILDYNLDYKTEGEIKSMANERTKESFIFQTKWLGFNFLIFSKKFNSQL